MELKLFTVKDEIDESCAAPFLARTEGTALAMFLKALDQQKDKDGEKFKLYKIGTFNDVTGAIEAIEPEEVMK